MIIKSKIHEKSLSITTNRFLLLICGGFLQHISVQKVILQLIRISKITMKRNWVMVGMYINEISFVQLVRFGLKINWDVCRCRLCCRCCGK